MTKRILVVDDDPILLTGMEKILTEQSYQVMTANNGFEALEQLPGISPDLIISDTSMPGMNGLEFFRRVRATVEGKDKPFLFLTAPSEKLPSLPNLVQPASLDKPFGPEQLLVAIETKFRHVAESQVIHTIPLSTLSPELLSPFFHEFRTSLTMIKTCIALLTNPNVTYDADSLREFLDIVRRGGDRVDRLVRDFLAVLKLESGVAEREAREAGEIDDLDWLVSSVKQSLQHEIAEQEVTVEIDVAEDLPALPISDEHFQLILEKLLHNAIKFTQGPDKKIVIRGFSVEDGVCFEVVDEGVGIPPEEQERIFDRFYQLARAGLELQGAGLGLAVAKGLVELYGGRIGVESDEDKGSTFKFVLPTERQVISAAQKAQEPGTEDAPAAEDESTLTAEEAFRRMGITFDEDD
jgi:signal transduction histidine kinase